MKHQNKLERMFTTEGSAAVSSRRYIESNNLKSRTGCYASLYYYAIFFIVSSESFI